MVDPWRGSFMSGPMTLGATILSTVVSHAKPLGTTHEGVTPSNIARLNSATSAAQTVGVVSSTDRGSGWLVAS